MSYFAKIDKKTNIVVDVISATRLFIYSLEDSEDWVQTSYNYTGGKKFVAIGDTYDKESDIFYRPQPSLSYVLNKEGSFWEPPTPPKENPKTLFAWDEENQRYIPHFKAEDVAAGNVPQWYLDKVEGIIDISNIDEIPDLE